MQVKRVMARAAGMRQEHATVDVGFRVMDRDRRVAAMVLAGGIAYRLFFWALALSLIWGGVLGFFEPSAVERAARGEGLDVGLAKAIVAVASSAAGNEWWLIPLGAWLLLWTGYTSAKALILTHSTVWGVSPPKLTHRLRASLLFTGGTLGLIAATAGARWLREHSTTWGLVTTLLLFAVPLAAWLFASRFLPNHARGWLDLAPGAALVAVGFQAMNLFTAYVLGPKLTSATQLYGVFGIVTTILFWFYITGRLIIASATLNAAFSEQRHDTPSESRAAAKPRVRP
jgi:uncharacterized BrkB/YihY/UPF0761 family membrane protein